MPFSPKLTDVPPLAIPRWRGWCCLRCLTLRGINMIQLSVLCASTAGASSGAAAGGPEVSSALDAGRRSNQLALAADDVALVDPHLHTDAAEGGLGLIQAVVDVSTQRVQWHPAFAVELRAAHFGAAETTGALHPDALDVGLAHRRLNGLTHRAAERHPVAQLLGDSLSHQLGCRLRVFHLENVELHLLARQLLQVGPDPVGLGAAATDDDARPSGVDVHPNPVAGALDLHVGDAGALQAGREQLADRHIFLDVVRVLLVRVPPGLPLGGDTEPESVRIDFLAHYCEPPFASEVASVPADFAADAFGSDVFLADASLAGAFSADAFLAGALAAAAFLAGAFFAGALPAAALLACARRARVALG